MIYDWVDPFFHDIAVPRAVGTAAEPRVRRRIGEQLESLGFQVTEQPFAVTENRLLAGVVFGAATGWSTLLLTPLMLSNLGDVVVLPVGAGLMLFVVVLVLVLARAEQPLRGSRMESANIVARNAPLDPCIWLVAHSDSKSQGVSLALRAVGFSAAVAAWILLVALLAIRAADIRLPWLSGAALLLGLFGGTILTRRHFGNRSAGAVDNAAGVVAALVAALQLRDEMSVGVLITGAEELGMEGARRWVETDDCNGCFINFDGIDSRGRFNLMLHGSTGSSCTLPVGALALEIAREIEILTSVPCRSGILPLGVFVDGAVLKRGGMSGITVSRGDRDTLKAIHTGVDVPARVDIGAARDAGRAAAAALLSSVDLGERQM